MAPIIEGHQSSALCHLANISYRLGKQTSVNEIAQRLGDMKVHDDVQETLERTRHYLTDAGVDLDKTKLTLGQHLHVNDGSFIDSEREANALLTREYRAPFLLPKDTEI